MHKEFLSIAKNVADKAARKLSTEHKSDATTIERFELSGREIKILADRIIDEIILSELKQTGISILSEESGFIDLGNDDGLLWIVDPLDGSLNFARNLGPSVVSIALWRNAVPVFGVLCETGSFSLSWGGNGIGAWSNGKPIKVSDAMDRKHSVLCTGLPARFDFDNKKGVDDFTGSIFSFSKVRMLGSAAYSLLRVASGDADAYLESNIMLWDVAAGIALVEGAGGSCNCQIDWDEYICSVYASNKHLTEQ